MGLERKTTPGIIPRARILDLIDESEQTPIIVIAAPAGYGKTTVARQWLARHPEFGVGWFQIDSKHNALDLFLARLWQIVGDALGEPTPAPPDLALEDILHRVESCDRPFVLVFDIYTLIENNAVHNAVHQLFRALPGSARVMLLSRHLPEIPLARLRAKGRLRLITQDDLAFTRDEIEQLFADRSFDQETITRLIDRTRGWIIALQLAVADIDRVNTTDPRCMADIIDGLPASRALADYIVEEVLAYLPADLVQFVLDTSVLTRLDPTLCDAVLQIHSSSAQLKLLEDRLVFVSRPAIHRPTLVYHPLFAETVEWLRARRFDPAISSVELRLRAAQWYRERGALTKAAEYALAAEAWDEAAALIRAFLPHSMQHAEAWAPLSWFDHMPMSVLQADTGLMQYYTHALLMNGRCEEARPLVAAFEHQKDIDSTQRQHGWQAVFLATLAIMDGDREESLHQSHRALGLFPLEESTGRLLAWSYIYKEETSRGQRDLGQIVLQQAEKNRSRQPRPEVCWHFLLEPYVANDLAIQGDLCASEELNRHFMASISPELGSSLGKFRVQLLSIYLEQQRLDRARAEVAALLDDMQGRPYGIWFPEALMAIANYELATGNPERARELLDRARRLSQQHGGQEHIAKTKTAMAGYWLHTGQDHLARYWADRNPVSRHLARDFGDIEPRTVHLRLLMRDGRFPDARVLAEQSLELARSCGHVAAEIEFLVWSSVTARAMNDSNAAVDALRQALELGAPGRFARVFTSTGVDLGDAIRSLLPSLSESARQHAITLAGEPKSPDQPIQPIPWQEVGMTPREYDVLVELVSGKSNRDIAHKLFITERTVKKHLSNLFQKTATASRTELALWGRSHLDTSTASSTPLTPSSVSANVFREPGLQRPETRAR